MMSPNVWLKPMDVALIKETLKAKAANLSVLCVEDEDATRQAIIQMLKRYFGTVMEAHNGEVGFCLYKEHSFDVIISDLAMPVMNGLVMSHAIKMRNPEQKMIILSAYHEEDDIRVLNNMGISHILLKPFDTITLMESLLAIV